MRETLSGNYTYLVQYINHGGLTIVCSMLNVERNTLKERTLCNGRTSSIHYSSIQFKIMILIALF